MEMVRFEAMPENSKHRVFVYNNNICRVYSSRC